MRAPVAPSTHAHALSCRVRRVSSDITAPHLPTLVAGRNHPASLASERRPFDDPTRPFGRLLSSRAMFDPSTTPLDHSVGSYRQGPCSALDDPARPSGRLLSSRAVLFPAYHSCPSTAGLSRVRPPSSNREVGTLSDSVLEPSSRRPAPSHYIMARFEDLGLVSPPASSSLLTISRIRPSTFTVEVIRAPTYTVGITTGETALRRPGRRPYGRPNRQEPCS